MYDLREPQHKKTPKKNDPRSDAVCLPNSSQSKINDVSYEPKRSKMMPSMMRTSSSIASSEEEDIESGNLSEHDDMSCLDCNSSAGPQEMVITVANLTSNGKMPRRRSACSQLTFRQHPYLSSSSSDDYSPWLLTQMPAFSSTSTSTSSSSRRGKDPYYHHIPILAALTSVLIIGISMFVFSQQYAEITSLRSQLEIANQSRAYLEKSASDLHSTLKLRQTALNHCNQAHITTTRHNLEISDAVRSLRRELDESKREDRRSMEDRYVSVSGLIDVEGR